MNFGGFVEFSESTTGPDKMQFVCVIRLYLRTFGSACESWTSTFIHYDSPHGSTLRAHNTFRVL